MRKALGQLFLEGALVGLDQKGVGAIKTALGGPTTKTGRSWRERETFGLAYLMQVFWLEGTSRRHSIIHPQRQTKEGEVRRT